MAKLLLVVFLIALGCKRSSSAYDDELERYVFNALKIEDEDDMDQLEQLYDEGLFGPETYASGDGENGSAECGAANKNTDEYVDKVLEEVRPKLPEPASLPGRAGRFRLFNGTLYGLPSLYRVGPALVRCTDSKVSVLVPVGLRNLSGGYLWEADTPLRQFRGSIDLTIRYLESNILYTRWLRSSEVINATVERFSVTRLEGVDFSFDGLGPLNRFASRIGNFVSRFFRSGVSRMLGGMVRLIINREVENVEKYQQFY